MTKATNFLDKVIAVCLYGIIGLLPIFILPITADVVEINKQFLLYLLVMVGLMAWVGKGIAEKRLLIRKSPLELVLGILLVVFLVASILSKNRVLSFWGDYTILSASFFSYLFYILLAFLVLNNISDIKKVARLLTALGISAVVSVAYFIVQVTNILPWKNLPIPKWTIVSDLPSHFGYFLAVALVGLLSVLVTKRKGFWTVGNIFGLLGVAVIFTGLVMLGFKSVWLVTAIAIFLFLVFALSRIDDVFIPWVSIAFGILIASILFVLLGTPSFLAVQLPTEVTLGAGTSWKIAASTLANDLKSFLFGSGPATFVYDFSAWRPEAFNGNFAWSLRFSKPYNSALEILSTTGLIGAIAWVGFLLLSIGSFFVTWFVCGLRVKQSALDKISDFMHMGDDQGDAYAHNIFSGLMTAWLTLLAGMFLFTFTTVHWVLFFFITAMAFLVGSGFASKESQRWELSLKSSPQYTLVASFIYILIFALIAVFMIFLGRIYAGEVYKAKAMKHSSLGNHTKAASAMFSAVSMNPTYSRYYLDLASAYIGMAVVESQKETPDQQGISNLIASAVNQAREATRLAPNDASAWDFLASMYATARPLSSNANDFVIASLQKAIELEKTNPRLYLDLAAAKVLQKDAAGAREAIEKAVALKQDYVVGYSMLSQLDELEGKANEAIEHMSVAAALSPNDPTLLFNLGRLYYNRAQADDLVRAEQLYILSLNLNPNYADALWSLGILYERQGKISNALELYRMVEKLNPNNADIKAKINRLNGGV